VEFSSKPDTYKLYNQDGFKGYFRATWPTWDNYGASTMYMDLVVQYADPASYFKTLATTADPYLYIKLLKLWSAAGLYFYSSGAGTTQQAQSPTLRIRYDIRKLPDTSIPDPDPIPNQMNPGREGRGALVAMLSSMGTFNPLSYDPQAPVFAGYSPTAERLYTNAVLNIAPVIAMHFWKQKNLNVEGGLRDEQIASLALEYAQIVDSSITAAVKEKISGQIVASSPYGTVVRPFEGGLPYLIMDVPRVNAHGEVVQTLAGLTVEQALIEQIQASKFFYQSILDGLAISVLRTRDESATFDYSSVDPWTDPMMVYDPIASQQKGYAVFIDKSSNQSKVFMNLPVEAKSVYAPTVKPYTIPQIRTVIEEHTRTGLYSEADLRRTGTLATEENNFLPLAALAAAGLYIYSQVR